MDRSGKRWKHLPNSELRNLQRCRQPNPSLPRIVEQTGRKWRSQLSLLAECWAVQNPASRDLSGQRRHWHSAHRSGNNRNGGLRHSPSRAVETALSRATTYAPHHFQIIWFELRADICDDARTRINSLVDHAAMVPWNHNRIASRC